MDRHGETNLTKILARSTQAQANLARSTQVPANLARLTNVGLHSSFSTLVAHTYQVSLATNQVPLAKNEE